MRVYARKPETWPDGYRFSDIAGVWQKRNDRGEWETTERPQERPRAPARTAQREPPLRVVTDEPPAVGQPAFITLDQVDDAHVSWLWPGRIPHGKLTILEGDPELGKSAVTLDIAARVTTGTAMPGETKRREPAGVLVICAEDDLADTIKPRLQAAGADLSRVASIPLRRDDHGRLIPLSIPDDLERIEAAIVGIKAALVVIDPITAYLSETIQSGNDASVRRATTPLADLAQRRGPAIVLVRHLNKQGDLRAKYRGGGSIAFTAAARSVLVVEQHPDKPDLTVLARVKNNLAKKVDSIGYQLVTAEPWGVPLVSWQGRELIDADTLLRGHDARLDAPAREEAESFLREVLKDGPVPAAQVYEEAEQLRISEKTLKRAKDRLGVESVRDRDDAGKTKGWAWQLPTVEEEP
jgi:AAA domain